MYTATFYDGETKDMNDWTETKDLISLFSQCGLYIDVVYRDGHNQIPIYNSNKD